VCWLSHCYPQGLDIGSFLIKPLQRLCQYPLLLRELLEALPDQQNVPFAKLQRAHQVMSETVETVNGMLKSIRKRTELQRLSDLLSHDGFRCSVVRPGRQFSMWLPFRVKVRDESSFVFCLSHVVRSSIPGSASRPKSGSRGSRGCSPTCSCLASARRARRPTGWS
jgi:hypothetical protein